MGDDEGALAIDRRAHARAERLAPGHPLRARVELHLGQSLQRTDRAAEALPLLERALRVYASHPGPEYPDALRGLGAAMFRLGRTDPALAYLRQSIAAARERGAKESEMFSQDFLATLLDNSGQSGLLAPTRRAYELAQEIFPQSDRQLLAMRQGLAQAQMVEGDARTGLALMEQTVEDLRKVVGGDHALLAYGLWQLGRAREQTGDVRGAIAPLREAWRWSGRFAATPRSSSPWLSFRSPGRFDARADDEAAALFVQAEQRLQSAGAPGKRGLAPARAGRVLNALRAGRYHEARSLFVPTRRPRASRQRG